MKAWRWWAFAVLAAAVALGALREFLFVNLNYQIDHVGRHTPFSYAHSLFRGWTEGMGLATLLRWKWALAIAFIALNWGLCLLMLRVLFGRYRYAWAVSAVIGSVGLLALCFHFIGRWVPGLEDVSVRLLHAIQYPVLLIVIWAASGLAPQRTAPRG